MKGILPAIFRFFGENKALWLGPFVFFLVLFSIVVVAEDANQPQRTEPVFGYRMF